MPEAVSLHERPEAAQKGTWRDYLRIARLDHSTKHVFIVPGIVLAYALRHPNVELSVLSIVAGFLSAILIAGGNYIINEWLDREFDAFHPLKSQRTAVQRSLSPALVLAEYAAVVILGLVIAYQIGPLYFATSVLFVLAGITYNVKPIRFKDRAYVDVISESINNPIRLVLGWTMIDPTTVPPASLLLCYWMGGAFLMAAKRLSEYRDLSKDVGTETLHRYRRSFQSYNTESLIVSCFLYAILSAFFIAIFLIKYRIEYVLAFPFIGGMFALYLWLSLRPSSIAQRPERLFRSRRLMTATLATVLVLLFTTFVDLPALHFLAAPDFIRVPFLESV